MDKYFFGAAGLIIFLTVILSFTAFLQGEMLESSGKVAAISLNGVINAESNSFGSSPITPEKVRDLNQKAVDNGASAILYEWNSGGGAVVASKEIKREIESVDLYTVCRFRDVAASGAYLASLGCDKIVADSATITGSIGVKSSYLEFSGLMRKLGIEYVNITSGSLKDVGSPYKNISDEEREVLQEKSDIIHNEFLDMVKSRRNISSDNMARVETGEIFLGSEAKELNLVDKLGGRRDAVKLAENGTGQKLELVEIERQSNLDLFSLFEIKASFPEFLSNRNNGLKASLN